MMDRHTMSLVIGRRLARATDHQMSCVYWFTAGLDMLPPPPTPRKDAAEDAAINRAVSRIREGETRRAAAQESLSEIRTT